VRDQGFYVVRTLVRYGFVPFMILGLNSVAFAVVYNAYSYAWLAPLLALALLVVYIAERVSPAFGMWNEDHGDQPATVLHAIVYEISNINGVLLIPVIVWLFPFQGIWPTEWPLIVQLLMALLVADFVFMMVHYVSHRVPLLWRLHAVHHGVPRLFGLNGLVRHPLHQTLDMLLGTAPLVVMGMPVDVAVLLGFVVSIQLIVQHANVDYALGPFRNHLSIGQLHHLHHVNWGKEGDCNFGLFLTVWDRMLGTFQPEPSRPIQAHDMGVDEVPDFPKGYIQQLIFPFVYKPGEGKQTGLMAASNKSARGDEGSHADSRDGEHISPAE
jgi:sterol desaturase/sphingolipid hydroxylase (fatty acid hydroxylase superfamily)